MKILTELIVEDIDEDDDYSKFVEPTVIIKKKDVSEIGLEEVYSCEEYTQVRNKLGVTIKIENQTRHWDLIDENTPDKMTDDCLAGFETSVERILDNSTNVSEVMQVADTINQVHKIILKTQENLLKGFRKVCEIYETRSRDSADLTDLADCSISLIRANNSVNGIYDSMTVEVENILQSGRKIEECYHQVDKIKNDLMRK